jgi:diacylglycerol kinase
MEKRESGFSIRKRLASFRPAFNGLIRVLKYEHNARIHLLAALVAIIMGILLHINRVEWLFVILCIGMVITAEIINTAIEKLVDRVSPEKNETARFIKDVSAAAVLVSSLIALVSGLIIFLPYLFRLYKR